MLRGQIMKLSPYYLAAMIGCTMVTMLVIGGDRGQRSASVGAAVSVTGNTAERSETLGVYLDHRGDGAIEFKQCGEKLCGHVVWVREGAPPEACGLEIIGDAAPVRDGVWDGGWILDPDIGQKFDVEITRLDLSETFLWKKAPLDLARCNVRSGVAVVHGR